MLTRLKVDGFKNLIGVDVRFGPFTCIAGANGIGKSNLFDAIRFLSALADRPLLDAASCVRDEGRRATDIRSLFYRFGSDYLDEMSFEAEMIVPSEDIDDLGQKAQASITFLRYSLTLAYRADDHLRSPGSLEITKEELSHIKLGEAHKHLLFDHSLEWRKSAVKGRRTAPFISVETQDSNRIIKLHRDTQDNIGGGKPYPRLASTLPRTVLSTANAAESPTVLLARREMQSWRLLQLEPSALRRPDEFTAPARLQADGSHLPAALYHLALSGDKPDIGLSIEDMEEHEASVYADIANRLSQLITDVREVWVDRDEKRELLTLQVTDRGGTTHPARALSDGTLRFLALAVLAVNPQSQGLLCLEEPENGIHPERIPAMLKLLQDIATDTNKPLGADNPLQQVIVNTHSPSVVQQIPDHSLLVAEAKEVMVENKRFKRVCFSALPDTWRAEVSINEPTVSRGTLLAYLNPVKAENENTLVNSQPLVTNHNGHKKRRVRRVIDRPDIKQLLLPYSSLHTEKVLSEETEVDV